MSVPVWFAQDEISVQPGESTSLSLAVENVGDHTESFTVIPAGLAAACTTVTRPNITLFGGSRDVIEVVEAMCTHVFCEGCAQKLDLENVTIPEKV